MRRGRKKVRGIARRLHKTIQIQRGPGVIARIRSVRGTITRDERSEAFPVDGSGLTALPRPARRALLIVSLGIGPMPLPGGSNDFLQRRVRRLPPELAPDSFCGGGQPPRGGPPARGPP